MTSLRLDLKRLFLVAFIVMTTGAGLCGTQQPRVRSC